ncbi:MAG: UDP-N-acetylmuramate dehydrogenase [Oscillospiraceae bacterium]|nr:UDP-N-acetylmuramate dehydrogenase [Oscillospiraceae bacterium]
MTFVECLRSAWPDLSIVENAPMAKFTSFHIGGPATIALPGSCEELIVVYRFCIAHDHRPHILGAGTNVLAPDEGLARLVICTRDLTAVRDLGDGMLEAECGISMARLACYARERSLSGLEFAAGIPGTVGGGVYMNAGAYGGEMAQVVVKTQALLPDGSLCEFEGSAHDFSYRHSVFEEKEAVILKTQIKLHAADKASITERMRDLARKRSTSQPLDMPSAGSTFKRPADGYAAALIDAAGLKGKGVGRAAVSEKHAGFVINLGGATAQDVTATMRYIQERVYEASGIMLEPEVRIW